ncbi:hypothetical protein [Flavobacterium luminosum]|uniref:MFS transporter n=1 Tax=Flavobacterium luminosum TaxID=2949086 RepID=A0ABT0TPD6_9FLAO|nr:hypothetical protein [Flavobacterium sp. HXWNR70]MCL9808934.1 hypothetical protein [Flavobacterium sp. HXWNR70]
MSVALGSALGAAVLHHWFIHIANKNFQLISSSFDGINRQFLLTPQAQLAEILNKQVLMVSFKETYGLLVLLSLVCMAFFVSYRFTLSPIQVKYPKIRTIKKMLRKEIA